MLDEHQDVQPFQQHRVDVQEVHREYPGGLGVQELPPRRPCAARRRIDPRGAQDLIDGRRADGNSQLRQFTVDPVPLEYSIAWLICSVTCGRAAVMVGWPGAAQGHLPDSSPRSSPRRPGVPQRPGQRGRTAGAPARERVRAENLVRRCDQQSCPSGRPAMMITGHVPAVRLPPDHATDLMAAAISA